MPPSRETVRLARGLRADIDAEVDSVTRRRIQGWADAWDELEDEWRQVARQLAQLEPGEWPSRAQINQATRVQDALEATARRLQGLVDRAGVDITDATGRVVRITDQTQPLLIASQYPTVAGPTARVAARFDRMDERAIEAIVNRTRERVTSTLQPLTADATDAMRRQLIRGVAIGQNPRETAREMLRRLEGRFNGGLSRALNVARTEMLDAYRRSAAETERLNSDVLQGWMWTATFDTRTCPSCLAQHGTVYDLEQPGPLDHQQGRCTRTPVTRTWQDLGFDIPEPEPQIPDAREWFEDQPMSVQAQIMGRERLQAFTSGRIGWNDMTARQSSSQWRDSFRVPPLRDQLDQAA